MVHYVTLTIDGSIVKAHKGSSVLEAPIEYGICIPHLCHMPLLEDIGVCRLCIVEQVHNGKAKITTSCTLDRKSVV
jgi:NADH dehydrogenase/NADH:ubiquinone oxidoreductase subunit G